MPHPGGKMPIPVRLGGKCYTLYLSYYCTYDRNITQKYSLNCTSINTLIFVITSQGFILLSKRKRWAYHPIPGVKGPCL